MTVQIKVLKGYVNPINNEFNSLTLLIKSSYEIEEHINKGKKRLLRSLMCIMKEYKNDTTEYYHKVQVPNGRNKKYPITKVYLISNDCMNLETSLKELLRIVSDNKLESHFVNVIITRNDKTIRLTDKEFSKIVESIRKELNTINNEEDQFIDNNEDANENCKSSLFIDDADDNNVKPIKKNNIGCLFIDDADDNNNKKNNVKPIKKNNVKPIKKNNIGCLFID